MDPDAAQAKIDEEIHSLELLVRRQLRELKTRRNSLARISRLPDEVLMEIFLRVKNMNNPLCRRLQSWHWIAHICARWRSVALAAACLWTDPPTEQHLYTLLMLQRSQLSPLYIEMNHGTSKDTCTAVFSHIQRISSLVLRSNPEHLQCFHAVLTSTTTAASLLKDLAISDFTTSIRPQLSLPEARKNLPALKSLTLANVRFNWQMFPLPSLTSLTLLTTCETFNVSWQRFAVTMNRMKRLRTLTLAFNSLRLQSPQHIALSLRHLTNLTLNQVWPSEIGYLFSCASFPRLQHLYISIPLEGENSLEFISSIWTLLEHGNFGSLTRLAWSDKNLITFSRGSTPWRFMLLLNSETSQDWVLKDLITRLPRNISANLVRLTLDPCKLSSEHLSVIFRALPNVQHLQIWLTPSVAHSLAMPTAGSDAGVPFPLLKSIRLNGVMKERNDDGDEVEDSASDSSSESSSPESDDRSDNKPRGLRSVEDFHRCLILRRENGFAVENLSIVSRRQVYSCRDEGLLQELNVRKIH